MIRSLRRARLLALVLLVATPALGGAWLQAAHPCPVDSPWLAPHGEHGDHGAEDPAGGCHCVGSCASAAVAVLGNGTVRITAGVHTPISRPRFTPASVAPAPTPPHRLPPSTAPPLV